MLVTTCVRNEVVLW